MSRINITIILVLATIATTYFYLLPEWSDFQSWREKVQQAYRASEALDNIITKKDELLNKSREISQEDLDKIEYAIPKGQKTTEFLVLLDALVKKSGFVLRNINIGRTETQFQNTSGQPRPGGAIIPPQDPNALKEFSFGFSVSGSYDQIKTLLGNIEKSLHIIDVQDLSIKRAAGGKEQFDVNITARAYYQ